jgi:hypothetical protein
VLTGKSKRLLFYSRLLTAVAGGLISALGGEMAMTDISTEANFDKQVARIRRLSEEKFPDCLVIFDQDAMPQIRFRIETSSGIRLSNAFPHLEVEQIEKFDDDELLSLVRRLCGRPE